MMENTTFTDLAKGHSITKYNDTRHYVNTLVPNLLGSSSAIYFDGSDYLQADSALNFHTST